MEIKSASLFRYPVAEQKAFLASFPEPKDCIERAWNQYRCQMKLNGAAYRILGNLASLPLIPYYLAKWRHCPEKGEDADVVFFPDGKPENIIPQKLRSRYEHWVSVENKQGYLSGEDRAYFRALFRKHPFSFLFLLKCLMKIGYYSTEIEKHRPKAVVVCNEYSYTSSLMTDYCSHRDLKHINVMHGEKLFYIRDAFFAFTECFVWDEEYIRLFTGLRAKPGQFTVAVPDSMLFSTEQSVEKTVDYTYYMGNETDDVIDRIVASMKALSEKGYRTAIRPHPRYTDRRALEQKAAGMIIEICGDLPIERSVLRTRNAVSLYSTVLNQAVHNQTGIVIDDVSRPEFYHRLEELDYAMLKKEHGLLSELIHGTVTDEPVSKA